MKLVVPLVLLITAAGAAQAEDQAPLSRKDVTTKIRSGSGPQRYYPEIAQRKRIEGQATALCVIDPNGRLTDCVVSAASPDGYGFAEAVVRAASLLEIAPEAKDGSPTAGRKFELHLNFKLPR